MNYWTTNIWESPNSEHLQKLRDGNYDGVIIFCHLEWEFYNILEYRTIIEISKLKNLKVYIIVGTSYNFRENDNFFKFDRTFLPDHVEIINYPAGIAGASFWWTCDKNKLIARNINSLDELLIQNLDNHQNNYHFLYLNNRPHEWRLLLIDLLSKHNLLQYSAYSWHNNNDRGVIPHSYQLKHFNGDTKILDNRYAVYKDQCYVPTEFYQSFFQLVSESTNKVPFLTEKTFMPIIVGKPFIIAGCQGIHKNLQELGFKLYDELFDYEFDNINDIEQRYEMICFEIKKISKIPLENLNKYNYSLTKKILYNRERLYDLVYSEKHRPELIQKIFKYYDETGIILDKSFINIYQKLQEFKKHSSKFNLVE
jgi:hypothetical protein